MEISLSDVQRVAVAAGKVGAPFIEQALTAIAATYTLGVSTPILNAVFPMINAALGIDPQADPSVTAAAIEANPDAAKQALDTLSEDHTFQLQIEKQSQDFQLQSQAQQVQIDTVEAANPSWFVGGWRPLIGWSLGGLLMTSGVLPYVVWLFLCFGAPLPTPPVMDQMSYNVLAGLLGLTVVARSADKLAGTSPKALGGTTIKTTKVVR